MQSQGGIDDRDDALHQTVYAHGIMHGLSIGPCMMRVDADGRCMNTTILYDATTAYNAAIASPTSIMPLVLTLSTWFDL